MRFSDPKVQVTVNFAVIGLTTTDLKDLRDVISVGLHTARKQREELHELGRAPMDRRIATAEEFLKNLAALEGSLDKFNPEGEV